MYCRYQSRFRHRCCTDSSMLDVLDDKSDNSVLLFTVTPRVGYCGRHVEFTRDCKRFFNGN